MNSRRIVPGLLILFAALLLSCTPLTQGDTGDMALHIEISGYVSANEKSIHIRLSHQVSGAVEEQDYALGENGLAYGYFAGLTSGVWNVEITLIENNTQIGTGTASAEITANSVTTGTARGAYSNGTLTFNFTWISSIIDPAITVSSTNTMMVYEKEGNNSLGEFNQYAFTVAIGEFQSLSSVSLRYPDGWLSTFGERSSSDTSASWISFNDNWVEAGRSDYYDIGSYEFILKDVNNAALMFTDSLDTSVNFGPSISNSGEIYNISPTYEATGVVYGGGVTITWDITSPHDATADFAVFVTRAGNTDEKTFSQVVSSAGPYSVTVPPASFSGLTRYLVTIAGCDKSLDQSVLDGMESYDINGILRGFLSSESTKDLEYVHYLKSYFTTN